MCLVSCVVFNESMRSQLTSPLTALSALPPSSPSLHFLPLFLQYLAQQLVYGGCPQTLHPAGVSSAGPWMCPGRAGWGSEGASGDPSGSPGEGWGHGATSSGRSGCSGSRVWGPGPRGQRWCGDGTDGGTAWGGSGTPTGETAWGTWEEEEGVNNWSDRFKQFSGIFIFKLVKMKRIFLFFISIHWYVLCCQM